MAKILTCPNCGNNKNLVNNNNTTVCSSCGYSWISVSNRDIKSSEIKVVMDSLNHYKYTLNNYNDDENTFPFYAIDNNFIENKGSNRNRLIRINPLDENSVKQNYVGVNRLKKPLKQRPIVRYSDNVDLSMYKTQSERVISDRTNQEYEISRAPQNYNKTRERTQREKISTERSFKERENQEIRDHNSNSVRNLNHANLSFENNSLENRSPNFNERSNIESNPRENIYQQRPQLSERNPNSFSRDTTSITQREKIDIEKKPSLASRINELNALNEYAEKDPERFFREYEVTKVNEDGSVEVQPRENNYEGNTHRDPSLFTPTSHEKNIEQQEYQDGFQGVNSTSEAYERSNDYIRPELSTPRIKKERLSAEQKEYKAQLKEREERLHREKKLREQKVREQGEQTPLEIPLTYEQYQEKRTQNSLEVKEQQKTRRNRIKMKDYLPKISSGKYQRGEKKYARKNKNYNPENELELNKSTKDYREKYLDKEIFINDNFGRETLVNHNISKKLRSEIDSTVEKSSTPVETKVYEKKLRDFKYKTEAQPSNAYNPSKLDEMINATGEIEESIINMTPPRNLFGKNPRLSFFENLKVNNDGTIKEDPLGLNQDYNEFFNKNDLALGNKKYNLKEIISEIKKRINKDKMSFNLVILIIIFGFFGMLSHFITQSNANKNDNKMVTEIDIGKDFINQIPIIDDSPAKGAKGNSDALVISKAKQDSENDTIINTTSTEDSQEILMQGKKNVASDLSLEELKNNKLADLNKTKTSQTQNNTSFISKTMMYLQQKTTQIFSDVTVVVTSSKWQVNSSGKYFEINLNINNKSTSRSYIVKTLEITLLDVSGNVIGTREIYPNKTLRIKETASSSIRIPKSPDLSASAYVKIIDIYAK